MFPANSLRRHIQRNRLGPVFEALHQWSESRQLPGLASEVSLLQSRHEKLKKDARLGLLTYDEEAKNNNRLTLDLLELISRIEAGATDFGPDGKPDRPASSTNIYNITQNHYGQGDNVAGDKKEEQQ